MFLWSDECFCSFLTVLRQTLIKIVDIIYNVDRICRYSERLDRVGFLDTLPLTYGKSKTPCVICSATSSEMCEYFLLGVRHTDPNYA